MLSTVFKRVVPEESTIRRFVAAGLAASLASVVAVSCGREPPRAPPDRRAEVREQLRSGGRAEVAIAAKEYRELMGEAPEALRTIADAYLRIGDEAAEFEVMRALVTRGLGTATDRRRVLALAKSRGMNDDALYRMGLTWLQEIVVQEPWCATFSELVEWTRGRPEHAAALVQALAGCPRDLERSQWLTENATQSTDAMRAAQDACSAVVHGATALAAKCAKDGTIGWQLSVAKALLGELPLDHLREASSHPDATVFVLLRFAQTPGVPAPEACSALARARSIETTWLPRAGDASAIAGRYHGLGRQLGCP
jgi:hypothetical protein